jgi:hypothetical protein
VVLALAGCGQSPSPSGASSGATSKGAGEAASTAAWSPDGSTLAPAYRCAAEGIDVTEVKSSENAVDVTISLAKGVPRPNDNAAYNLCLPAGVKPRAGVVSYAIGERKLWPATGVAATTGTLAETMLAPDVATVTFKGWLRRWPIWRMDVPAIFWQPLFRSEIGDGLPAVQLVLRLSWSPVGAPDAQAAAAPIDHDAPMKDVARRLVINPQDLDRYASAHPPLREGARIDPIGPQQMDPTATAWARIRVDHDGLYRLTPEALAKAGFADASTQMDHARVFALGKPVPTLVAARAGDPSRRDAYFYGWRSRSPYDPRAVYWIALDPKGQGPRMTPIDAALLRSTTRTLDKVRRREVIHRDTMACIERGEFLDIRGLRWLDRALEPNQPTSLTLRLFEPLPPAEQPAVQARLELAPAAPAHAEHLLMPPGGPLPPHPVEIQLTRHEPKPAATPPPPRREMLARKGLADLGAADMTFSLPTALLADGPTTLDLRLADSNPAAIQRGELRLWLDSMEVDYMSRPALRDGKLTLDAWSVPQSGVLRAPLAALGVGKDDLAALAVNPAKQAVATLPIDGQAATALRDAQWHAEFQQLSRAEQPAIEPMHWPSDALDMSQPVDYLIVTHGVLATALGPLLKLNERRGLATRVIDVDALDDYFSGGMLSPDSIRAYLAHWLVERPDTAPSYVLLVGDATNDYLGLTHSDVKNWVPTYPFPSDGSSWASDYWFGCVTGQDDMPDFQVARISVDNVADLRAILAKIERYQANSPGPWRSRVAFVADNLENFREATEELRARRTPPDYEASRIYLDDLALEDDWHVPQKVFARFWTEGGYWRKTSGEATRAILDALNQGTSVLFFLGHGSPNIWTDERIWLGFDSPNRDSQFLRPSGQDAFIVNYTCNSSAFDYPMHPYNICMSEDFMRTPQGGAIATYAPSGPGSTETHQVMARLMQQAIFEDQAPAFGAIAALAGARCALENAGSTDPYMFVLMGDPALELALTRRRYPLTLIPTVLSPSQRRQVQATCDHVQPPEGQCVAWLADATGKIRWHGQPQPYRDGKVSLTIPLPDDLTPPEKLEASIHGWNATTNQDWLAGAPLQAVPVRLRIEKAEFAAAPDGLRQARLTAINPGPAPTGDLTLKLLDPSRPDDAPVFSKTFRLEAGERQTIDLGTPTTPVERPVAWLAEIPLPDDSDQPSQPSALRVEMICPPAKEWTGLLPDFSHWDHPLGNPDGQLRAVAFASRPDVAGLTLALTGPKGQAWASCPASLVPIDGGTLLEATLDMAAARARAGLAAGAALPDATRLELRQNGKNGSPGRAIDALDLSRVAQRWPRLRVIPETIRHEPPRPTDGHTIWVHCIVENHGEAASQPCSPRLLDGEPGPSVKALPYQSATVVQELPSLGPGRRVPVTLRWDPIQNQGKQVVWIDLQPKPAPQGDAINETRASYSFYVLSKSKLEIARRTWVARDPKQAAAGKGGYHVLVRLANRGETDAHGVEVTFYKTPELRPRDEIGKVVIDDLPALSERNVDCPWPGYDPKAQPSAEVRLIGSLQRVTGAEVATQ